MTNFWSELFQGYTFADLVYFVMLAIVVVCIGIGHRSGRIDLWDCVRTTKGDKVFTDPRKLYECGAFVVSTVGFSYLLIVNKMTEFYLATYIGAFVAARSLRDREQRLHKAMDMQTQAKSAP